jgi:hypothetical protein
MSVFDSTLYGTCAVFLKLELEEKGKVAESYRVDNYKLLQRLEALVTRDAGPPSCDFQHRFPFFTAETSALNRAVFLIHRLISIGTGTVFAQLSDM